MRIAVALLLLTVQGGIIYRQKERIDLLSDACLMAEEERSDEWIESGYPPYFEDLQVAWIYLPRLLVETLLNALTRTALP